MNSTRTVRTLALLATLFATSCSDEEQPPRPTSPGSRQELPMDHHSQSRPNEVRVKHLRLHLTLDFAKRQIRGGATLEFDRIDPKAPLVLDTDSLTITSVTGSDGEPRQYALGTADPLLGRALAIQLADGDGEITVEYATSPDAKALQWLDPEQTASRKLAYLYTQGQAILTRSWIPIQDTPGVRITYAAQIHAPAGMRVVMSAATRGAAEDGMFPFAMEQAIPPYLLALACGDIAFRKISERCGVFADPSVLDAAIHEFADTEKMLATCEQTFGPYLWGRYDILVLPPAFPFGGMENPTLTFATPTIITGDRSLVALIAHELAHSWSGNLVTNATWRDFWLNEGFTVYLEQRIMELVFGRERAEMEIGIGVQGLREELAELKPKDQILHIDLTGRNPDDAMTAIAYDKGAAFLRRLEQVFGRATFDEFLSGYFAAHAFRSITTAQCLAYLDEHLLRKHPKKAAQVDVQTWVHKPGLPATMPEVRPQGFAEVDRFVAAFRRGESIKGLNPKGWITHQWLHFIHGLPSDPDLATLRRLEVEYHLATHSNPEIRCAFLTIAVKKSLDVFLPMCTEFVSGVGRRKFLVPIFKSLTTTEEGRNQALQLFDQIQHKLHSITRNTLQKIIEG